MRFVCPQDEQIVAVAIPGGFIEATECVGVEKHLEERVHVATFELKFLRHRDADDFAAIDVGKFERIPSRAEDLRYVRRDECLQVVCDCFLHAADLFRRLREETVGEMLGEFATACRLMTRRDVGHRFIEVALVEQQVICIFQRHIRADLAQCF